MPMAAHHTLPETNIAPENQCLEDEFPFEARLIFRGYVSFRECRILYPLNKKVDFLARKIFVKVPRWAPSRS